MTVMKLYDKTRCIVTVLKLYGDNKNWYDNIRFLVTVQQLYCGPKVSRATHGALLRFYNFLVVIKLVLQHTVSCDSSINVWWS